jgi:hypothetical protein
MLQKLRDAGLKIAVAKGDPNAGVAARLAQAGLAADLCLDVTVVREKKGGKGWVRAACSAFGLDSNELLWLGDSPGDMHSAVNSRVIYFNAAWSAPTYAYGIQVATPGRFALLVRECFVKPVDWYWRLDATDSAGRAVTMRSMIDGNGAGIPALKDRLITFLHAGIDPRVGPLSVGEFATLHLLGSLYAEGLYERADVWTLYPSSSGGPAGTLDPFVDQGSKLFRDRYLPDALWRHTPSRDTSLSRVRGEIVEFLEQANTVCLRDADRDRIVGKRVLIVDDFTSDGNGLEWARNLFLRAGASEVIAVTIGKYGQARPMGRPGQVGLATKVVTPRRGLAWDAFAPATYRFGQFVESTALGPRDPAALDYIRESYRRVEAAP